jgi:hypothetical protein
VITVRQEKNFGQFIFPKNVLHEKGFVSRNGVGGKRAMRVYPPWDVTDSTQAQKTQDWQLTYFVSIEPTIDHDRMKKLFL